MWVQKMKFLPSAVQKLSSEQTDKQIDMQIPLELLPTAYADGKKSYGGFIQSHRYKWGLITSFCRHFTM